MPRPTEPKRRWHAAFIVTPSKLTRDEVTTLCELTNLDPHLKAHRARISEMRARVEYAIGVFCAESETAKGAPRPVHERAALEGLQARIDALIEAFDDLDDAVIERLLMAREMPPRAQEGRRRRAASSWTDSASPCRKCGRLVVRLQPPGFCALCAPPLAMKTLGEVLTRERRNEEVERRSEALFEAATILTKVPPDADRAAPETEVGCEPHAALEHLRRWNGNVTLALRDLDGLESRGRGRNIPRERLLSSLEQVFQRFHESAKDAGEDRDNLKEFREVGCKLAVAEAVRREAKALIQQPDQENTP